MSMPLDDMFKAQVRDAVSTWICSCSFQVNTLVVPTIVNTPKIPHHAEIVCHNKP